MDRRQPGTPPPLGEKLAAQTPEFTEKLLYVFEIIPVVPLTVAPGVTTPVPIVTPPQVLETITAAAEKLPPGAVRPPSPIRPNFLGQLPPIVLEGHNITRLSLDLATHGFAGELSFRVSDTTLLGDVTDKDKVAKAFRSQNLLMLKLVIRPAVGDVAFPRPLTMEPVPQVVGEKPVPIKAPPAPTEPPPQYKSIHLTPPTLPDALMPVIRPILEPVGTPVLFEPGVPPFPPLLPIELVLNAVITEHTVSEHTSLQANDLIVSVREYHIQFTDPAQAVWGQHFPLELYTNTSIKSVIEHNTNPLITILAHSAELSHQKEMIFLGLSIDNRLSERASFYDWLIWQLDELHQVLEYDYSQNVYKILSKERPAEPFEIFAADIGKITTIQTIRRHYTERVMNDFVDGARTQPIVNLQALNGLYQDRLFSTPIPVAFEAEWLRRFSQFHQPEPEYLLYFKRFPSRPFPPGVGFDFKLDPIDFPNHRFLIPAHARKTNRVYRMKLQVESLETDVLPRYKGYSGGHCKCSLAVWLESGTDKEPRLPDYTPPRYPMRVEGKVVSLIPVGETYEFTPDPVTGITYYSVEIPLWRNQKVPVRCNPMNMPGHLYYPPYAGERVLLELSADRAEIARFLAWRPGAQLPLESQGNHIVMGRSISDGTTLRNVYEGISPTFYIDRHFSGSQQFIRMDDGGVYINALVSDSSPPLFSPPAPGLGGSAGTAGVGGGGGSSGGGVGSPSVGGGATGGISGRARRAGAPRAGQAAVQDSSAAAASWQKGAVLRAARSKVAAHAGPGTVCVTEPAAAAGERLPGSESRGGAVTARQAPASTNLNSIPESKVRPGTVRHRAKAAASGATGTGAGVRGSAGPVAPGNGNGAGVGASGPGGEPPSAPSSSAAAPPLNSSLGMNSGTGIDLSLADSTGGGSHSLRMDHKGNTLRSKVGTAESSIEQHGDTIIIRCRKLRVEADKIHMRTSRHSRFQSMGQMTLSSLSNMAIQTPSALGLTAMNGVTINALSVLIHALRSISLLGISGGVGVLGGGPGVQLFGSNVAATGLTSTLAGVTTNVIGATVNLGPAATDAQIPDAAAESPIPGLVPGDLLALSALLTQLVPAAAKPVPGSVNAAKPPKSDSAAPLQQDPATADADPAATGDQAEVPAAEASEIDSGRDFDFAALAQPGLSALDRRQHDHRRRHHHYRHAHHPCPCGHLPASPGGVGPASTPGQQSPAPTPSGSGPKDDLLSASAVGQGPLQVFQRLLALFKGLSLDGLSPVGTAQALSGAHASPVVSPQQELQALLAEFREHAQAPKPDAASKVAAAVADFLASLGASTAPAKLKLTGADGAQPLLPQPKIRTGAPEPTGSVGATGLGVSAGSGLPGLPSGAPVVSALPGPGLSSTTGAPLKGLPAIPVVPIDSALPSPLRQDPPAPGPSPTSGRGSPSVGGTAGTIGNAGVPQGGIAQNLAPNSSWLSAAKPSVEKVPQTASPAKKAIGQEPAAKGAQSSSSALPSTPGGSSSSTPPATPGGPSSSPLSKTPEQPTSATQQSSPKQPSSVTKTSSAAQPSIKPPAPPATSAQLVTPGSPTTDKPLLPPAISAAFELPATTALAETSTKTATPAIRAVSTTLAKSSSVQQTVQQQSPQSQPWALSIAQAARDAQDEPLVRSYKLPQLPNVPLSWPVRTDLPIKLRTAPSFPALDTGPKRWRPWLLTPSRRQLAGLSMAPPPATGPAGPAKGGPR